MAKFKLFQAERRLLMPLFSRCNHVTDTRTKQLMNQGLSSQEDLLSAQQGGIELMLLRSCSADGFKPIAARVENLFLHRYHGAIVLTSPSLPQPSLQSSQESSGNFVLLFSIIPLPREQQQMATFQSHGVAQSHMY